MGSLRLLLNQCIYKNGICYRFQSKFQEIGLVIKTKARIETISFRPFEDDWIELRRLAFLHKVSMCKMFVKLLEREFLLPNPNRLRLPGFAGEQIPFPTVSQTSTNQHIQTEDLSIFEEGKLIQVAS